MNKIALVAVAYNRLESLARLLDSLNSARYGSEGIHLIISVDKSDTTDVAEFANGFEWKHGDKHVRTHERNLGLRDHIMSLGEWFSAYDALVVLEDDLIVSPWFYDYVEQTVEKYSADDDIAGIGLYGYRVNYQTHKVFEPANDGNDVFFMNCAMSWGEIWLKRQWTAFYEWYLNHQDFPAMPHLPQCICKWSGQSWLKYHTRYCMEENKYFVIPNIPFTTNCDETGVHQTQHRYYTVPLCQVEMCMGLAGPLRLPEFRDSNVRYDGFFENKAMYDFLGFEERDLCLDLTGGNPNLTKKRYWLTSRILDYRIVESWGMTFRPIEYNIFRHAEGNQIFLYDTAETAKNPYMDEKPLLLYGHYINDMFFVCYEYGFWRLFKKTISTLFRIVKHKIDSKL